MVGCWPKSRGRTDMSGATDETCEGADGWEGDRAAVRGRGTTQGGIGGAGRGRPD
jgi:hypothetical protein